MATCFLVSNNTDNCFFVEYLKKFTIEYIVLDEYEGLKQLNVFHPSIIIFYEVSVEIIGLYRRKDSLSQFIYYSSNKQSLEKVEKYDICYFIDEWIDINSFHNKFIQATKEFQVKSSNFMELGLSNTFSQESKSSIKPILALTKNEQLLIDLFLRNSMKVYSAEYILDYFFNLRSEISLGTLRNIITNLRNKIPNIEIQNIYGYGYHFVNKNRHKPSLIELEQLSSKIEFQDNKSSLFQLSCVYLLHLFDADRAFIAQFRPSERVLRLLEVQTKVQYSENPNRDPNIPLSDYHFSFIENAVKNNEAYILYPQTLDVLKDSDPDLWEKVVEPKTIIFIPFHAKSITYTLGLHQCSYERKFSEEEIIFFKHISRNIKNKLETFKEE